MIGAGTLLATRPSLQALGFPPPDPASGALARLAGSRDLALGALTFATREDASSFRAAALTGVCVDTLDAVTLGLAGREKGLRPAGIAGVLAGASAAIAGACAARQLSS